MLPLQPPARLHSYMCVVSHECTGVHVFVCVRARMHACMHAVVECLFVCIHACTDLVCVCTFMQVCARTLACGCACLAVSLRAYQHNTIHEYINVMEGFVEPQDEVALVSIVARCQHNRHIDPPAWSHFLAQKQVSRVCSQAATTRCHVSLQRLGL